MGVKGQKCHRSPGPALPMLQNLCLLSPSWFFPTSSLVTMSARDQIRVWPLPMEVQRSSEILGTRQWFLPCFPGAGGVLGFMRGKPGLSGQPTPSVPSLLYPSSLLPGDSGPSYKSQKYVLQPSVRWHNGVWTLRLPGEGWGAVGCEDL
jgi:hypothetical protein